MGAIRARFKFIQQYIKLIYLKKELLNLIKKSLLCNHFLKPQERLSHTLANELNKNNFFKTYQKLVCPHSLSKKVPDKSFMFSRFFLNKKLNTYYINNVFK